MVKAITLFLKTIVPDIVQSLKIEKFAVFAAFTLAN